MNECVVTECRTYEDGTEERCLRPHGLRDVCIFFVAAFRSDNSTLKKKTVRAFLLDVGNYQTTRRLMLEHSNHNLLVLQSVASIKRR